MTLPKRAFAAIALAAALAATPALAFETATPPDDGSGNTAVASGVTIHDNLFAAGNDVDIRGAVDRDVFAAGQRVTTHQGIGNNLFAAGENVVIHGDIQGDVFVAGSTVTLDSDATVHGDLVAAGRDITLNGAVNGKVWAAGSMLRINSVVGRDLSFYGGTATLGSQAHVQGNVTGSADQPLALLPGAVVDGQQHLSQSDTSGQPAQRMQPSFLLGAVLSALFMLCMTVAGAALAQLVAPTALERVRATGRTRPRATGLIGMAAILLWLPASLLSAFFVVTLPVTGFLLAGGVAAGILGQIFAAAAVGDLLADAAKWKNLPFLGAVALGSLILSLVRFIPLLGSLIGFLALSVGVGSLVVDLWEHYLRPKRTA